MNADERCGSKTLRRGIKSALPVSETKERPSSSLFRFLRRKEKKKGKSPRSKYLVDGERQLFFVRERCLRRKKKEEEKKREKKSGKKKMEEQKEQKEKEKEKEKEEKEEHFHTKSVKVVVTHTHKNMYGRRRRRRRKQKEFKRKPFLLRAKRR